MSRRCKPGQRARIVSGADTGAIVVVVRYYFGETLGGATWPQALLPWVVTSLGRPLHWVSLDDRTRAGQLMTIVRDDSELEPLPDDDDGLSHSTGEDRSIKKPVGSPC